MGGPSLVDRPEVVTGQENIEEVTTGPVLKGMELGKQSAAAARAAFDFDAEQTTISTDVDVKQSSVNISTDTSTTTGTAGASIAQVASAGREQARKLVDEQPGSEAMNHADKERLAAIVAQMKDYTASGIDGDVETTYKEPDAQADQNEMPDALVQGEKNDQADGLEDLLGQDDDLKNDNPLAVAADHAEDLGVENGLANGNSEDLDLGLGVDADQALASNQEIPEGQELEDGLVVATAAANDQGDLLDNTIPTDTRLSAANAGENGLVTGNDISLQDALGIDENELNPLLASLQAPQAQTVNAPQSVPVQNPLDTDQSNPVGVQVASGAIISRDPVDTPQVTPNALENAPIAGPPEPEIKPIEVAAVTSPTNEPSHNQEIIPHRSGQKLTPDQKREAVRDMMARALEQRLRDEEDELMRLEQARKLDHA